MVRVKGGRSMRPRGLRNGFLSEITVLRHFWVIIQLLAVCLCFGGYAMLKSQEDKAIAAAALDSSAMKGFAANAMKPLTALELHASGKPYLVYGTAWKKEKTAELVNQAVHAGFRFIDTACQPKHYQEPLVGNGWKSAAEELQLDRSEFFLQTKFTSVSGQDPNNIPYDQTAPLEDQVRQSLKISLKNLHTPYLDSWVMHGPERTLEQTMVVWRVMEEAVDAGKAHHIGISNMYNFDHFKYLYENARIKPSILQNRFYSDSNFDTELRNFCTEHGIKYQSFWTLTANRHALASAEIKGLAEEKGLSPQTYMFAFLMSLGKNGSYVTPLSGTTSQVHMAEDVAIMERMQKGEAVFANEEELHHVAKLLGMPEL